MLGAFGFRRSRAVGDSFNFKLETIEVLPRAFLGDLQQIDDFTCETVVTIVSSWWFCWGALKQVASPYGEWKTTNKANKQ